MLVPVYMGIVNMYMRSDRILSFLYAKVTGKYVHVHAYVCILIFHIEKHVRILMLHIEKYVHVLILHFVKYIYTHICMHTRSSYSPRSAG